MLGPAPSVHAPDSDDALVHRILAGESALFEHIMRRHNQRVFRAARAIVRDDAEAEDVMQETYRTVFVLREVEGLSTATTAECLGVSEEVVKTRLSRARLKLRDGLYERAGVVTSAAFTFGAERCDRIVAAVLPRLIGERG
jgi:DNA-directed RNA polymerase specialized sigma24 family protein